VSARGSIRARIKAVSALFVAVFAALVGRAVQLTVVDGEDLATLANVQHTQQISVRGQRGTIVDRHGEALALSRESVAVYARPQKMQAGREPLAAVARLLEEPADVVAARAGSAAPFVWLDRQVPLKQWSKIESLGIAGIGSEPGWQRVYPHGPLAGQVLGFIGIDGQGLEGVERSLDAELRGEVEALDFERDAWGRRIVKVEDEGWSPLPRVGARVELTIDAELQEVVETDLERAVHEFDAVAGSAVVLSPKTGEVLAMATAPRFDPAAFRRAAAQQWRDRPITDVYEPGSTFKAILAAAALEAGVVSPQTKIDCEHGAYRIGKRVIHDHEPYAILTFADVIAQSSNIGSAKVAGILGSERLAGTVRDFGFGSVSGIDLPGEAAGLVLPERQWKAINLATTAFGQGIAVTPLQLARAFAAIANGGFLMRPYLVRRVVDESGRVRRVGSPFIERRVISARTAEQVTGLLRRVVESGTGKAARLDGVTVAGKTGTAQKIDVGTGRYHPRDRMASFVGYLPAEDPELVILVVVDSPKKAKYGGVVAAPVFRRIAEYALARRGLTWHSRSHRELEPPPAPPVVQVASAAAADLSADPILTPSFLGLDMREALVRAHRAGWDARVDGSGYVVAQDPPPGTLAGPRQIVLEFGSLAS
jgi:cell division protein FtsI (penicillin-binding protein 3)